MFENYDGTEDIARYYAKVVNSAGMSAKALSNAISDFMISINDEYFGNFDDEPNEQNEEISFDELMGFKDENDV